LKLFFLVLSSVNTQSNILCAAARFVGHQLLPHRVEAGRFASDGL